MLYQFEVTQEDIDHGIRYSCCGCPVAMAIGYKLNKLIYVDGYVLSLPSYNTSKIFEYKLFELPQIVKDFIRAFDDRLKVQPFTFEMELPF